MRRRLGWLLVPLCWALACGGRYTRGSDDGDFGGSSTGEGGSGPSRAGTPSSAGRPVSGGAPTAGTTSVGGCACGPTACAPGYTAVPTGRDCCFECELDPKSCEEQQMDYRSYREAVLFKYARYKCTTAMDCTYYYDKNECQVFTCGFLVDRASIPTLDAELNAFARMTCNPACPADPVAPCIEPSPPLCFKGYCE